MLAWLLTLVAGTARVGVNAQTNEVISYILPAEVTQHQPVLLDLALRNQLDRPLTIELGAGEVARFEFRLQPPSGSLVVSRPTTTRRPGYSEWFESAGHHELAPGRSDSVWILLSQFLDFDSVGTYELTIRFNGEVTPIAALAPAMQLTRTTVRQIRVLPRDEDALRRYCASLVAESRSPMVTTSGRALTALAHVQDPVAVPYLLEAAEVAVGPPEVAATVEIEALVRIGGEEARRALELLARSSNPWTVRMAQEALKRIK
ncbi:MAG: HEAT repeat domain-containing protein [Vicinamibacterales bacterium]